MNELTITLDETEGGYLYEQIYQYIKREIRTGRILAREKLPSARALAEYLQVSRSTVNVAYEQLLSEGYIESKPCKGYFACPVEELFAWEERERNTISAPQQSMQKKEAHQVEEPVKYRYDFSPHMVEMQLFPFGVWRKISRKVLLESNTEMMSLGHPQGDLNLRVTIARYLHQARGVNCRPEQIVVGAGTDYLLMLLYRILGDQISIAMEDPTYIKAYRMFESFHYQIETVSMDNNGLQVEQLKKTQASVVYVMPSHQFPMGIVMPIGRRMELLNWAGQMKERYLIEDDYDSEFRFRGKPIPALQASDKAGKVIYMGTFSKSVAPAIRTSYMVLPENLLEIYQKKCGFLAATVSRVDQAILSEFIESGSFERHLHKMRKCYKEKHDLVLQNLKPLEDKFQIQGTEAGLHFLLTSRKGLQEEEMIHRAEQTGVRIYGLSEYVIEPEVKQKCTVLLGFGGLSIEQITQGIKLLCEVW